MSKHSYNFHNDIVTLLQNQELEVKKIKAQYMSSLFTLYYTQGNLVTATQKLQSTDILLHNKAVIKNQVVQINNLSDNVLTSANQENSTVNQSVSNAAVCAANIQAASKAIVELASNVGSIYNIINATDSNTDIYEISQKAFNQLKKTAYNVEKCSQDGMDASILISEVNSNAITNTAQLTNTAVQNLFKSVNYEFKNISQELINDHDIVSHTSLKVAKAENNYKNSKAEYLAAKEAYETLNKTLNLDLKVIVHSENTYEVSFNLLNPPFNLKNNVNEYYILVVKEKNKSVFTIENAEYIITLGDKSKRYLKVSVKNAKRLNKGMILREMSIKNLLDDNGKPLVTGEKYVVFIMAVYNNAYKKETNHVEDYLSAPSKPFKLSDTLSAPDYKTFTVKGGVFSFKINKPQNINTKNTTIYRCMFIAITDNDTFFNLTVAKQISEGNYTTAELKTKVVNRRTKTLAYGIDLNLDTTDTNGNPLMKGKKYKPVVIAVSTEDEVHQAISDSSKTKPFAFNQIANH